jgi:hypothetical protein
LLGRPNIDPLADRLPAMDISGPGQRSKRKLPGVGNRIINVIVSIRVRSSAEPMKVVPRLLKSVIDRGVQSAALFGVETESFSLLWHTEGTEKSV